MDAWWTGLGPTLLPCRTANELTGGPSCLSLLAERDEHVRGPRCVWLLTCAWTYSPLLPSSFPLIRAKPGPLALGPSARPAPTLQLEVLTLLCPNASNPYVQLAAWTLTTTTGCARCWATSPTARCACTGAAAPAAPRAPRTRCRTYARAMRSRPSSPPPSRQRWAPPRSCSTPTSWTAGSPAAQVSGASG